jgi:hypothetical protein
MTSYSKTKSIPTCGFRSGRFAWNPQDVVSSGSASDVLSRSWQLLLGSVTRLNDELLGHETIRDGSLSKASSTSRVGLERGSELPPASLRFSLSTCSCNKQYDSSYTLRRIIPSRVMISRLAVAAGGYYHHV